MATENGYSTVLSLMEHLQIVKTIPNKDAQTNEEVGTGDDSNTIFWLKNIGVIEGTYTLYVGSTPLTDVTDYAIDLNTSKITLTSAGVTALGTSTLYAAYSYNSVEILNSEALKALNAAENKLERETDQHFADGTATDPAYRKVTDEFNYGHYNGNWKVYDLFFNPMVDLGTTVNGDYTTGGTEIVLTDATGFPNAGTIYIGGNKVTYTGKSTNTLTIPATTPSIDDGATVRGEVMEISTHPEGSDPSYTVLDPETEYQMDFLEGRIKPLNNAYWGEVYSNDRYYPENILIRSTYFQAWHEFDAAPVIPDDVEEVVNMIASKKFVQRVIKQKHIDGMNDFQPTALNSGDQEIADILEYYKPLNVGTSPYNRQYIS